ncbi:hypothetical protein U27_00323 [Candidatus Vecturithrix granuli]|uniref:histidine kinase n=1 Tax=Vecturithrix granuli TaxID=1499967 RepID=A0A081C771_VECG1|nr:hypothetical protein U27_00323 [Candidatus Vecturithrix granuli]
MQKGFIICVDDQPEVVGSLMTQLENAVGHLCEIEVAESALEALEVLKELKEQGEQIEIVITDEIMPGMQGSKLLEIVHQLDPNIMTAMLTGQAGFDDVVYAVNHAALNKCLKKPWEYQELKETVLDLLEKAELNRKYERLTQEVVTEKNKAEAIVQSITDGIIVVNDEDKISLVNQACLNLLGLSEKDLLGKRLLHVLDSRELALLFVEASQRTDEVISEEFVLKRGGENMDEVTVIAIAKTLRDKYQHQIGVVTVLRDVTQEKEISRMKANFLATISHELRTPLTSILSTYELLLQDSLGELTQEQREFINLSRQQGEYLSELIDNLIVLNRLEANQIDIAAAPMDLARIARDASSTAKISALAKGVTFHLNIEPQLPQIIADETQITHLIKNLLSNAVKFTESGEIRLKIGSDTLVNQKGIHITVIDTGIGIAAMYFEKIFEKFFQIDDSTTREFGGPGVGLAICRAIVQAHHGRIWVESEVAKGSTFHVLLPLNSEGVIA